MHSYVYIFCLQNELHIHNLSSGQRIASLPLYIGSVTGFSGRKNDTEVCLSVFLCVDKLSA